MSTALATLKATIAAQLQQAKASLPPSTGTTIRITRDKQFEFPDGLITAGPFDSVIVGWRYLNALYTKRWNPNEVSSPDCWAQGEVEPELAPHESVKKAQAPACAECPYNEWGSGPEGRGKKCKNIIKLAIVAPDADAKATPLILKTSPTATGPLAKYLRNVISGGKMPIEIITTIGFNPDKDFPTIAVQKGPEHNNLEVIAGLLDRANELLDRDFSQFSDD